MWSRRRVRPASTPMVSVLVLCGVMAVLAWPLSAYSRPATDAGVSALSLETSADPGWPSTPIFSAQLSPADTDVCDDDDDPDGDGRHGRPAGVHHVSLGARAQSLYERAPALPPSSDGQWLRAP